MAEKKHSAFALLDILVHYSDEEHILSIKEIQEHLEKQYDLLLERRTLYSNMDILEQAGYQISRYEDNGKGYFLEEKQFSKGEILLLCNALHASHFISAKQSNRLIKKLLKTQSQYEANEFKGNVYMPNSQKTENGELMYNITIVSEAIRDRKMLQFTYNKYNTKKKLTPRREESYVVEPRYIVYSESRPYLIATNKKYNNFTHYRLDRISKAVLLEEKVKGLSKNSDAYEYAKNKLFMYAGETEKITFLCDNQVMDAMIDLFGSEVDVYPREDEHFVLQVSTSRIGAKFLAQQFLDAIQILEPLDLRQEFQKILQEVIKRYQK